MHIFLAASASPLACVCLGRFFSEPLALFATLGLSWACLWSCWLHRCNPWPVCGFMELLAPACRAVGSVLDFGGDLAVGVFLFSFAGWMANPEWVDALKQAALPAALASAVAGVYTSADVFRHAFKTENVSDQFAKKKLLELHLVASWDRAEAECHPGLCAL